MKKNFNLSIQSFHLPTLLLVLSITIIGILFIFSTTHNSPNSGLFIKQLIWLAIGLAALIFFVNYDYHKILRMMPFLYFILVFSLATLFLAGKFAGGARSWFILKYLAIQPSEIGKIIMILFVAKILADLDKPQLYFRDIIKPTFLLIIPVVLIAVQPDMGTALTYLPILVGIIFVLA